MHVNAREKHSCWLTLRKRPTWQNGLFLIFEFWKMTSMFIRHSAFKYQSFNSILKISENFNWFFCCNFFHHQRLVARVAEVSSCIYIFYVQDVWEIKLRKIGKNLGNYFFYVFLVSWNTQQQSISSRTVNSQSSDMSEGRSSQQSGCSYTTFVRAAVTVKQFRSSDNDLPTNLTPI